ncbi:hypothetical protein NDU88_000982 [Pleurodeles waltl]|uniref:Uncharacterized protein n=1 Tax=Pleurodeles waltl TaxID=8319 RepID=A0AAV7SYM2_PLEWA|nr:hypothetical protein NDU88_000982 [Pleurodeles waltl]
MSALHYRPPLHPLSYLAPGDKGIRDCGLEDKDLNLIGNSMHPVRSTGEEGLRWRFLCQMENAYPATASISAARGPPGYRRVGVRGNHGAAERNRGAAEGDRRAVERNRRAAKGNRGAAEGNRRASKISPQKGRKGGEAPQSQELLSVYIRRRRGASGLFTDL